MDTAGRERDYSTKVSSSVLLSLEVAVVSRAHLADRIPISPRAHSASCIANRQGLSTCGPGERDYLRVCATAESFADRGASLQKRPLRGARRPRRDALWKMRGSPRQRMSFELRRPTSSRGVRVGRDRRLERRDRGVHRSTGLRDRRRIGSGPPLDARAQHFRGPPLPRATRSRCRWIA